MRKFTLFVIAALVSVVTFAQKPLQRLQLAQQFAPQAQLQVKGLARQATAQRAKAPRRSLGLVTPPTDAEAETYYTASGTLAVGTSSGWSDATSSRPTIKVIVDGSDMYIAGLAYYAEGAWIKGTIEGTTVTFPTGQQVDDDADYPEWLQGSDDWETLTDIVFEFDQEAGTLTATTTYILEAAAEDGTSSYAYWSQPSFTKEEPAGPELVVLPEGVETVEYTLTYENSDGSAGSAPAAVAVDGNDVYVQGFSYYLPEAWVKGTKDGNTVTFPSNQYVGTYGSYGDSFAFYGGDAVFTYDEDTESYSAEGQIFGVLGGRYYDGNYFNPVLKKVLEKAAMPANPAISQIYASQYGDEVVFNVPTVDVNGEGLLTSKLSFQFFIDIEKEVSPLTFEAGADYPYLAESISVIPYGFKDNDGKGYDFYDGEIFLNMEHSSWNKIGIKSIYLGGGETNETEVQWFDIKDYAQEGDGLVIDFNAMDVPTSSSGVDASNDGDITEDYVITTAKDIKLTISPKAEGGNTTNRFWDTTNGPQLRVYSGTLTFDAPEGAEFTQIVFNYNGAYWGGKNNAGDVTADSGEIAVDAETSTATWTGQAASVVFTIGGNTQINSIEFTLEGDEPVIEDDVLVELPEGIEAEVWTLEGSYATNQGTENVQQATEVAFDGTDIYVKGLAYYFEDAWIKGTIEDGVAIFPTGQFVGEDEYGKEYLLGTNDGKTIEDIQFAYDAEAQTLTQVTQYILENGDSKTELSFYGYWYGVQLYAGEPIVLDPVQAPEDLVTETYVFKSTAVEYEEDEETGEVSDEPTFEPYEAQVQVGFDGDDLYIQGISADYAEGWVKATRNEEGKYVIPANQYMGTYDVGGLGWFVYDYFFTAVDEEGELTDVVFSIDEETGTITTDQVLALNGSKNSLYYYLLFYGAEISKFVEVAATPADPEVLGFNPESTYPNVQLNVPAEDAEGNALLESKLFYTIYYVKDAAVNTLTFETSLYESDFDEDVTEVPYSHEGYDIYKGGARIYLNQTDVAEWTNIGVQSIYYGGDEVHKSNIAWLNPDDEVVVGIASVNAAAQVPATYFDLQGRVVSGARKGLFIKQYTDADGSVKTEKVLRK